MMSDGEQIDGRVEAVADGVVLGWAWDRTRPTEPITIRVSVDGKQVAETRAENFRADLAAEAIGSGTHGFAAPLPADAAAPGNHVLIVTAGTGHRLEPTARFTTIATRSDDPWYGAQFVVDHTPASAAPSGADEGEGPSAPVETPDSQPAVQAATRGILGGEGQVFDPDLLDGRADGAPGAAFVLAEFRAAYDSAIGCGARFLPVLLPAKEDVYVDHVPERLQRPRPAAAMLADLHEDDLLDVLDMLPALREGARRHATYSKTGANLTGWGDYVAYRAIAKRLYNSIHGAAPPIPIRDVTVKARAVATTVTEAPQRGRPVAAAPAAVEVLDDVIEVNAPAANSASVVVPEHLMRLGPGAIAGFERADRDAMARVVVVGSPRLTHIAQWLAEGVRSLLLVSNGPWMGELLALERPDALVWIVDERAPSAV